VERKRMKNQVEGEVAREGMEREGKR